MIVLLTILLYFVALFALSRWTARRATNDTFFRGERRSPWRMVAFGMVGASISGVTFVSVPGMVLTQNMAYLQLCLGFILGYVIVAFVLLPVYYKLNLTSIYTYLGERLGPRSYMTGAGFFLLSKMIGTAVKFYVACFIVQQFVMDDLGVPFAVTVGVMVLLIWLYTHRGGVRTLVFTDSLHTLCLFSALLIIIYIVVQRMGFSLSDAVSAIAADERSRIFVFDDWVSRQNFWKQLLSGAFIVVVMTGLDQDMMQKNLTCRTLREAQKNMCSYGVAFVPVNLLFLCLGVLLAQYFEGTMVNAQCSMFNVQWSMVNGDQLLPWFVQTAGSIPVLVLFTLGIVAASFSSADSALTALTTSYCVDIRQRPQNEHLRRRVHIVMCLLLVACVLAIRAVGSDSLIDAIYTIVSYTYGPLLGLFAFGLFTKRKAHDALVPWLCIASPVVCFLLDQLFVALFNYHFGYELLLLNGLLTFCALFVSSFHDGVVSK
ncbi:MAG: sodium:solute symporter [Prevotella sp.]|nr:sodium:solute symporter [Prevotella sp.]